jgi:hypothetical protein
MYTGPCLRPPTLINASKHLTQQHYASTHLIDMTTSYMTTGNRCKVKDDLVNQLVALNNKLNTLSPALLRSEQARAKVQEQRERLYVEIKRHRAKGHDGKPCPAIQRERTPYPAGRF